MKPLSGMAPFSERLKSAAGISDGNRIRAVGLEAAWGTRYTNDTVRLLKLRFPNVRFTWLMGADIMQQLPAWKQWLSFAHAIPFAVVPRPGYTFPALAGRVAKRLRHARVPRCAGRLLLSTKAAPAWVFLPSSEDPASASAIRDRTRGVRTIATLPPDDEKWRTRRKAKTRRSINAPVALPTSGAPGGGLAASVRKKASAAGPRKARKPQSREARAVAVLEELQRTIVASLEDDKAVEIVTLDLVGRASFADRMIIATGLADRQLAAMAQHLEEKLKRIGRKRLAIEGRAGSPWILVDAGDIVIHLFKPEARALYALERMWGAELDDDEQAHAG